MPLLTNMSSFEELEGEISAVMETVLESAVKELRRLLELCSANAENTAEKERSKSASMKTSTGEKNREQERQQETVTNELTDQFAALMAAWTKGAVEKILMMLRVSLHEAEDGPAAEQRAGLNDGAKQSVKPKATKTGCAARPMKRLRSSLGEHKSAPTQESDHAYHRAEAATEESNSGSLSEPEAVLTEQSSVLDSGGRADVVLGECVQTSPNTSKNKKPTGPFKCPSCDKLFTLKCMMERHYLIHSKPHLCSECGKRFSVLRGLHAHSRRHTGEKLYKCSECGTEFAHKSTYVRHMRRHSLVKPHTHTCTLCENKFIGVLALQRHRCSALKKTFICSLCPETFECRQNLADHENLHSGSRDFVCEMCGDSFFSSSSLSTHRVTHMQKKNCCDTLGFGSSDLSVLRSHLSKHTGEKLFSCEVCGKGCSHRSALKHHMLTHTGERPYVCETCGKRCGHASALQNHMRIHTGKKPGQQPVCDICGKKFRRTVNLKYHMSIHTGVKPYACDQCDKTFSNPSNMKLHAMIHTRVKMYGCNVCGRRFNQASGLKQHRRVHTGEWRYSCQVCGKGYMNSGDFRRHQGEHLPQGGQTDTLQ